jgi:hypothetical protein
VGSAGQSAQTTPTPTLAVSVRVTPESAEVLLGNAQAFTAAVANTDNTSVTWTVNGVTGGTAALGTITPAGVYTAPAHLPSGGAPTTMKIAATSLADTTKSASAELAIASDLAISLVSAATSVELGAVQEFHAAISSAGHPDTSVQWSVVGACAPQCGSVDASGRFTAPQILPGAPMVTVTAQSVADPSKQAATQVAITSSFTLQITGPSSVIAGSAATVQASLIPVRGSNPSVGLSWSLMGPGCSGAACGSLNAITEQSSGPSATGGFAASATYTAPASLPTPNIVTILVTPQADRTKQARATLTIQPAGSVGGAATVSPATATVAANHRVTLTAQAGSASGARFTWTVNGVAAGNTAYGELCVVATQPCQLVNGPTAQVDYMAPGAIPNPNPVTVQATSAADPTKSASAQITVINHEVVTVSPASVTLAPLSVQAFSATVLGSETASVVWQIQGDACVGNANCGSITAGGTYTAPGAAPSPDNIQVVAISADDTTRWGAAVVTVSAGANIRTLHPASVYARAAGGFTLRVDGSGFTVASVVPGSVLVLGGTPRATQCSTSFECTAQVSAADVAQPGNVTVQIVNADGSKSNAVSLVVADTNESDEMIALTSDAAVATEKDIVVVDPTTAGVSVLGDDVDLNVAALGLFSVANNSCALTGNPVAVQRPANGTATVSVCLYSESGLDTSMVFTVSGPGDISVIAKQPAGLGIVQATLAIPATAAPGARSIFIQNANLDKAAASGFLEVY